MSTTTNIGLNQPANNTYTNIWDQPLNFNETILDSVLGNTTSVSMPTGASATTTLTGPNSSVSVGQTQAMRIALTGALSANQTLQFPAGIAGQWIIYNSTSGAFTITVSSAGGGTTVKAPQGFNISVYSDGTNIRYTNDGLSNSFATLTVLGNTNLATTSGNVGIGTTSPGYKLEVYAASSSLQIESVVHNFNNSTGVAAIGFNTAGSGETSSTKAGIGLVRGFAFGGGALAFYNNNSGAAGDFTTADEKMRLDASGNLLVGTTLTNLYAQTTGKGLCYRNSASLDVLATSDNALILNRTTTTGSIAEFRYSGTVVGTISVTGSATAYNTSSDYRLKENVIPITAGLATVSALKPVTYNWISDKSQGEGFIAHELQAVIPHAVTGTKDAIDADGKPIYQGVDYSKVVVHLVAAIQEQQVTISALTARIAALEEK